MKEQLVDAYIDATYKCIGNGVRSVSVLKKAFDKVDDGLFSDMYGEGDIINDFEMKMAKLLGKPSAVFFPSGTMAQQIGLRVWCDGAQNNHIAYHPLCHLEIHEKDGVKALHHLVPHLLGEKSRLFDLEDITNLPCDIAALLIELPQREIGGQLPSYETLEEISRYCKMKNIKLHLDGARLFEVLPYYDKSAAEVCSLFDSVYISFYKGLGGIAGAILAGPVPFTETSKVWKRRHGGDLISLYPYIISADYYYELRAPKMATYYNHARLLAYHYNLCDLIYTSPLVPVSNMFHVHVDLNVEEITPILIEVAKQTNVGLIPYVNKKEHKGCYFEVSIGDNYEEIPASRMNEAMLLLRELMGQQNKIMTKDVKVENE